jgi:aminoglycoside phosphotransferase (APT) family kinase protein
VLDQGSLLHGDLDAIHLWVDSTQQQVTSLIDFGERKAGDAIWDLVEYDWTDRAALLDGYALAADQHAAFFQRYHLYALLRAIPWAHHWYALGGEPIKRWLQFTLTEAEQHLC